MDNISLNQIVTLLALCSFAFYFGWIFAHRRAAAILKDIERLMTEPGALEEANETLDWAQHPVCLKVEPFLITTKKLWFGYRLTFGFRAQLYHNASPLFDPAVNLWGIEGRCGSDEIQDVIGSVGRIANSFGKLLSTAEVIHDMQALNIIEK